MTIVTKSFDDEIFKLVPVNPTDEMQISGAQAVRFDTTPINKIWTANAAYKSILNAIPSDLPGVITHSGEPVCYVHKSALSLMNDTGSCIVTLARNYDGGDASPLFIHAPQAIESNPSITDEQITENTEKRQCWAFYDDDFRYESLGELFDNNCELKAGDIVKFGEVRSPSYSEFCDADDIIEVMRDHAYDIGGEYADDFPDVTKEAEDELNNLLQGWMQKHCCVNFWTVENIKSHVLTDEDCIKSKDAS